MPNFNLFSDQGNLTATGKVVQQERMKQLEQKVFRELVLENTIVRAVADHGRYNSLTQYDMLLEMVVALAENNKHLTNQIIDAYQCIPKPIMIHCTPEQAAKLMERIEPCEITTDFDESVYGPNPVGDMVKKQTGDL